MRAPSRQSLHLPSGDFLARPNGHRRSVVLMAVLALTTVLPALASTPAQADTGDLVQKLGTLGCISSAGGLCTLAPGAFAPSALVLSPDGKNAYGDSGAGINIFDRDPATGALTLKPGVAGCIAPGGDGVNCGASRAARFSTFVTVSADGKHLYVPSSTNKSVAVFDRDPNNGTLTQKAGVAGCASEDGTDGVGGSCADAFGLAGGPRWVAVSPNGGSVYVATFSVIAVFDRNPTTGMLTQRTGTAGCISADGTGGVCTGGGRAFSGLSDVKVSPDGKNVYAGASNTGVLIFDRDTTTGVLTQKPDKAGCVTGDGSGGVCAAGNALSGIAKVEVSADSKNLYALGGGLAIFDRDTGTGALTQKSGSAGCITFDGSSGGCVVGVAVGCSLSCAAIALSSDGRSVYTTKETGFRACCGLVATLDRNPNTGVLTQKLGTAGCISEDGTDGVSSEACVDGRGLAAPRAVVVSPDAKNVYAVGRGSNAIAVLDRDLGDILAADTTIEVGPAEGSATGDSTPTFEFSSDAGSTYECRVDAAAFAPCASPLTTAALLDGAHSFAVRATDAAFNLDTTPATRAFTVDTAAPDTSIASGPTGTTGEGEPTFALSSTEAGSTFECRVDGGAFAHCDSQHTTAALSDGAHTFQARATDAAGNVDATPAARAFTVDTVTPQTTIASGPAGRTANATPTFAFGASVAGSTFQCRVDESEFAACVSPHTTTALADGAHTFEVRATGPFGGVDRSPARRSFTVDTAVAAAPAPPPPPRGGPINGTPGADRLVGTPGNDVINCGGGNDVVVAGGGDDVINCGAGDDVIDAGAGNDRASGGPGNDKITGGAGNDSLSGNAGNDSISGNAGNDRLLGGAGRDRLLGGPGRDVLIGGGGLDALSGGPGKDRERQ